VSTSPEPKPVTLTSTSSCGPRPKPTFDLQGLSHYVGTPERQVHFREVVGPASERRGLNRLRCLSGRGCLPVRYRQRVVEEDVGRGGWFHARSRGGPPGLLLEDPQGGVVAAHALAGEGMAGWVAGVGQHPQLRLHEPGHERDQRGLVADLATATAATMRPLAATTSGIAAMGPDRWAPRPEIRVVWAVTSTDASEQEQQAGQGRCTDAGRSHRERDRHVRPPSRQAHHRIRCEYCGAWVASAASAGLLQDFKK